MKDKRHHEKLMDLFAQAVSLAPSDREAFLEVACAGDESLLAEALEILAHDSDPEGPVPDRTIRPIEGASSSTTGLLERLAAHSPEQSRYEGREQVARGGMGAILKVRDADLQRDLAMKVVLEEALDAGGRDNPVLERFLAEARVTGQLEHPGIVPVHELGVDSRGTPYFTMRLVRGFDFKEVIARIHDGDPEWTFVRGVNVVLKACEATSYAHAKGVVHRDIKPANLMVGHFGEVYVMDWGLARVLGAADPRDIRIRDVEETAAIRLDPSQVASDDSPLETVDGHVIGTPVYMSPEQARGQVALVGPASDVYSMGAVLYELLAGHMPYVPSGEKRDTHEILRRVQSGPPEPLAERAPEAAAELIAICQKAMSREPDGRYESMLSMAADLRAFLEGRTVRAHRTGALIELRKWVARNKAHAATIAVGVTAVVGLSSASALVLSAKNQDLQVSDRRNVSLRDFMSEILYAPHLDALGPQVRLVDAIQLQAELIEERFEGDPESRAFLHATLGGALSSLGQLTEAREHLELALEHYTEGSETPRIEALTTWSQFVRVMQQTGSEAETIPRTEKILAHARRLPPEEQAVTVRALIDQGLSHARYGQGLYEEGLIYFEEALSRGLEYLGEDHEATLSARNCIARCLLKLDRADEAVVALTEVHEARERTFGAIHEDTLVSLDGLGYAQLHNGDPEAALASLEEALDGWLELAGEDHIQTARCKTTLGSVLLALDRPSEAVAELDAAVWTMSDSLGPAVDETITTKALLVRALLESGEAELAEAEALACLHLNGSPFLPGNNLRSDLYAVIVRSRLALDRLDEALESLEEWRRVERPEAESSPARELFAEVETELRAATTE